MKFNDKRPRMKVDPERYVSDRSRGFICITLTLFFLDCRGRWRDLHGAAVRHTALGAGVLPLLKPVISNDLTEETTHGRCSSQESTRYKRKLPATPIATPVLHAYIMPDRNLTLIFHTIRRARTRTLALYMRRCPSLLPHLLIVPIPKLNLVFFLRLPARIALGRKHGGPILAPKVHFVAFVCRDAFAPSAEGCEFRAIGRCDFAA